MQIRPASVRLVQLNFGLSMYLDRTFGLSLSLSLSLSRNIGLRPKFGLSERLSEITSLLDLSLVLDRTLAPRKAQRKAKSKSEVAQCDSDFKQEPKSFGSGISVLSVKCAIWWGGGVVWGQRWYHWIGRC